MGLYVRLNIKPDQIDAERWEAVWLTSLQLLEQFPGPLAALIVDKQHESRYVLTPRILFQTGTDEERWEATGDLGSNRFAETYSLNRHLSHYQQRGRRARQNKPAADILWAPAKEMEDADIDGASVFSAKSQGYPYHYAMLAVAILVENSFPGQALAYGDINRAQAEQIMPWAEAVLGRPLQLPVATDAERLWQRLAQLYANEPRLAIRRFGAVYSSQDWSAWRALLQLEEGPESESLRQVYQAELSHYKSLRQRGAHELIAALVEADGGLERAFAWVCGLSHPDSPCRFDPEELLECLCDLLVPVRLDERDVLDALTPPPDQLPTIETQLFQVFSSLMGKPVVCHFYLDENSLGDEFAARWPDKANHFNERLSARTAKIRSQLGETRAVLDQRLTAMNHAEESESFSRSWSTDDDDAYRPGAEFIHAEIVRQRRKPAKIEIIARELGSQLREGLTKNREFCRNLVASSHEDLLRQISLGSSKHGFGLSESAWEALKQADNQELCYLTMLALLPLSDKDFWEARLSILETADLWPVLSGKETEGAGF